MSCKINLGDNVIKSSYRLVGRSRQIYHGKDNIGLGKLLNDIVSKVDFTTQKLAVLLNKWSSDGANKNVTAINKFVTSLENQIFVLEISALEKKGIDELKKYLRDSIGNVNLQEDTTLVTNIRHLEALKNARVSLSAVSAGLASASPTDLVAQDLREAITSISSILGEDITPDTVLHHIFAHHCIGK